MVDDVEMNLGRDVSKVSAVNSTRTLLGAGETFTGKWEMNDFEHVAVNSFADQDGTLFIDTGIYNPTTQTVTTTYVSPGEGRPIKANQGHFRAFVKVPGRVVRVRYVNGDTPQGNFLIHTAYGDSLHPSSASDDNETLVTVTERERDTFIAQRFTDVTADEYKLLVDLDDLDTFFHDRSGRVDISNAYFGIDRDASATGSVRIGVITRIDGTDADISYVAGVTFQKSDERAIFRDRKYSPSQLKCGVSGGALSRLATGFTESAVTAINTGATLESPLGNVTPSVGDLIIKAERTAGSFNASVSIMYHGEANP